MGRWISNHSREDESQPYDAHLLRGQEKHLKGKTREALYLAGIVGGHMN